MNTLIPFSKFSKTMSGQGSGLSNASVVVNDNATPLGFFFGRDALISLMGVIDEQFENNVSEGPASYNSAAGRIIDLIEEHLPINPQFEMKLRESIEEAKKNGWVPLREIRNAL